MELTAYDLSTGRIVKRFHGPQEFMAMNVPDGCSVVQGYYEESTHRVDLLTHQPVRKPQIQYTLDKPSIQADGFDTVTISGLPIPTMVQPPEGESILVEDGSLEVAIDLAGSWFFVATSPLYLPTTIEIIAE